MTISRAHMSTHRGDVIYLEAVRWPVNCFTGSRSMFNLILSSQFGSAEKLTMHTCWTSMLWRDSCKNRVSSDQYYLTVSRAQDVQNEIKLLSGVFCYSWLVCLLGFWLSQSRIVFIFHRAWYVRGLKSLKRCWLYLIPFRSCISNGKPV